MAYDNTVTITGNVTRNPEQRTTQTGMSITTFGVAWNKRRQGQEDETSFFDVVCFRELADNVTKSIRKGTRIIVFGTLQQRTWQSDSGERRSKTEILADEVAPSLKWATAKVTRTERNVGGRRASPGHRSSRNYGRRAQVVEPF